MNITEELKKIYKEIDNVATIVCNSTDGCDDCKYYFYNTCCFDDVRSDVTDLINISEYLELQKKEKKDD